MSNHNSRPQPIHSSPQERVEGWTTNQTLRTMIQDYDGPVLELVPGFFNIILLSTGMYQVR